MLAALILNIMTLFQGNRPSFGDQKNPPNMLGEANQIPDYFFDIWESAELAKRCNSRPHSYLNLPPIKASLQELWTENQLIDKIGGTCENEFESSSFAKSIPCHRFIGSGKVIWKVYKKAKNYEHRRQRPWISQNKVYASSYGMPISL